MVEAFISGLSEEKGLISNCFNFSYQVVAAVLEKSKCIEEVL